MKTQFLGEFAYSIDSKGRLVIPAKIRHAFDTGIILTIGLEGCLWGFTREGWERFAEKLSSLPVGMANARALMRLFFSQAVAGSMDKQGRVLVPDNLRDYADLDGEVVIVGVGDHIEIWSPERWEAFKAAQHAQLEQMAEALADFGI